MRLRILLVVTGLMLLISCVKHDIDPKLKPYLFAPQGRTVFTDAVDGEHLVCIVTDQYLHPEACAPLRLIRMWIQNQAAGL